MISENKEKHTNFDFVYNLVLGPVKTPIGIVVVQFNHIFTESETALKFHRSVRLFGYCLEMTVKRWVPTSQLDRCGDMLILVNL